MFNHKNLSAYKVLDVNGKPLCIVSDYSLESALSQATDEVSEAFDVVIGGVTEMPSNEVVAGKSVCQHILECSSYRPQRVVDFN